jgi:hypothetical protein
MPFNEKIAGRIREALKDVKNLTEKKMFGGIAFMVNDKMCVGVDKDSIMFDLTGKPMKGWLLIDEEGTKSKKDFDFWINTAIEANKKATTTKVKKK